MESGTSSAFDAIFDCESKVRKHTIIKQVNNEGPLVNAHGQRTSLFEHTQDSIDTLEGNITSDTASHGLIHNNCKGHRLFGDKNIHGRVAKEQEV